MMKQYREARQSLEDDTLLLFRLGDFYEMFENDAVLGAKLLGITLTKRHDMPMAGIPSHAAESYLSKLLAQGRKVAICDQLEPPKPGKLVKRGITRILTPGTVLEDRQLEASHNHFLLALDLDKRGARAAWLDLSTGKFALSAQANPADLFSVIHSLAPREVLMPESLGRRLEMMEYGKALSDDIDRALGEVARTERPDFDFDQRSGAREVMESLGVMNLEGFGIDLEHAGLGPAGAVLVYAQDVLKGKPGNLTGIDVHHTGEALLLDPATQRNLEVFRTSAQTRKGSLLDCMDETVSPAGARLVESFLARPERDVEEIERRQSCVLEFSNTPRVVEEVRQTLRQGADLERILGRLRNRVVRPRELGGLRATIRGLPAIRQSLIELGGNFPAVQQLAGRIELFEDLTDLLNRALEEELPAEIKLDVKGEGGRVIRCGYNEEFDKLRDLAGGGKRWILELETAEREKTGISNLKVKYNGAFGYFIEVTKANLGLVPDHYIRKQTMTNAERFYTDELRSKEKEILNAEEQTVAKEQQLFEEVVIRALKDADQLTMVARVLAEVDVFSSWGAILRDRNYCMPKFLVDSRELLIEQGRHPVVETVLKKESLGLAGTHAFVPNDTSLSSSGEQLCLITGPNMAGKSTYIRQVALITLMAQVGSGVPAKTCQLGLVDRIFSRVGAGDELAKGNSTFMVEMNETANILNHCTSDSLIVLDEIGRGTSTYDGLSIAWAVIEHLHGNKEEGPKTLFATHYHELTRLSDTLPRLKNYSVAVKEWNDEIIFVRQVTPGASERSFGIQVARLAGLPDQVVGRAKQILASLEAEDPPTEPIQIEVAEPENPTPVAMDSASISSKKESPPKPKKVSPRIDPSQLELF